MKSISCLYLPTFRSQASIVSENPLFSLFPIEKPKFPNLTLLKIGQGLSRVIIYINYDGQESPMLHTKFCGNLPAGSGEEDF